MKKLCIYHGNCADGFTAAWVVKKALGDDVDFHAGVHQNPPPDVTDREVIIVDFSYKKDVLIGMAAKAKGILVLDHHKSAESDLVDLPENVTAIFDMNRSGAMMAWDYFFPNRSPSFLIKHVQDRDLWCFNIEGTKEFQINLFSYEYSFENWDMIDNICADDYKYRRFIDEGAAIGRKHMKDVRELINVAATRGAIRGYNVPILNAPYFYSSEAGHIMGENEPFAACYWDVPEGRIYSLRSASSGVDVSTIASSFGGGGHKHASGFRLPFDRLSELGERMS